MKLLKKADVLLIILLAVIPLGMLAYNIISAAGYTGPRLVILVDGEVYETCSLDEDRDIEIGDTNICRIKDGQVTMIHANCPDQVCVHSMPINRYGGTIVCLPNKIVLTIEEADVNTDEDAPDAIAS